MHPDKSPFASDLDCSDPMTVTPNMASQNRCDGPKGQRPLRQHRGEEYQQKDPEDPTEERSEKRQLQGLCPAPLFGHQMTVKRCRDIGGRAGYLEKNGADGPAGDRRRVGGAEKDQPLHGFEMEGERNQQCDRHCRRQPRRGAENQPADGPDKQEQERDGFKDVPEVENELQGVFPVRLPLQLQRD